MPAPPDFAMLIGKRLGKKAGDGDMPPPPSDDEGGGDGQQKDMAISAMKDFIAAVHARSPEAACEALDQYRGLSPVDGDGAGDSSDGDNPGNPY